MKMLLFTVFLKSGKAELVLNFNGLEELNLIRRQQEDKIPKYGKLEFNSEWAYVFAEKLPGSGTKITLLWFLFCFCFK